MCSCLVRVGGCMYLVGACICMSARSGDGGVKDGTDYVSNASINQAPQIAGQGEG
jgi:hypothetical protein